MLRGREISDRALQIDSLDGLRGLAVLLVFLSHTSIRDVFLFPRADFAGMGRPGVFLFFVLSAFLLTYPFVAKANAILNRRFLANYVFRRFLRIFPLYLLYLGAALTTTWLAWSIGDGTEPAGIPFSLTPREALQHVALQQGKGVTWSILVEFRYYLVLPVLAAAFSIGLKNRLVPSLLLTALLILASHAYWPPAESALSDPRLGPYLPIFFMGSFLALLHYHWNRQPWRDSALVRLTLELLGVLCSVVLLLLIPSVASFVLGRDLPTNAFHRQFALYGLLWSVVLFAAIHGAGLLRRVLELPPLRYLGFISFSLYLLHIVIILQLRRLGWNLPLQGWVMLALSIGISHISYSLIEKPTSRVIYRR